MKVKTFFVLLLIGFTCGCSRSDSRETGGVSRLEQPKMSSGREAELMSRVHAVTNLIQVNPALARSKGVELRDWICRMENPSEQMKAIDSLERSILAVDMRLWAEADRERGVNAVFDLEMEVVNALVLSRAKPTRIWQSRFEVLRRIRREMEFAREDAMQKDIPETDKIRLNNVARFVGANYHAWLKMFEYDFVVNGPGELSVEELEDVRRKFEETIGRPLKSADDLSNGVRRNQDDNGIELEVKVRAAVVPTEWRFPISRCES